MRNPIYIILLVYSISCVPDSKDKLIGAWYKDDGYIKTGDEETKIDSTAIPITKTPRPPVYYPFGFDFMDNDSVEYFLGVWEKVGDSIQYVGSHRYYSVKGDSLFIYDSDNKNVKRYRLEFQDTDTLRIHKKDTFGIFVRFKSHVDQYIEIDSIKIQEENGWGKRIEYKVCSSGAIFYTNKTKGYEEDLNIYNEGQISQAVYNTIELKYNEANFLNLGNYSECCDGTMYTITIYHGGEVKTVYDYMNTSPMKFIWANAFLIRTIENELVE